MGVWLSFLAFTQLLLGRLQWSLQASFWDNLVAAVFSVGFGVQAGLLTYSMSFKRCVRSASFSGAGFFGSVLAFIAYPLSVVTCCGPAALSLSYIVGGYLYLYQYQTEFALAGLSIILLGLVAQVRVVKKLRSTLKHA